MSTRPRIKFDDRGFCSACLWAEEKKKINWNERQLELKKLLSEHRDLNKNYDCITTVSGGKDGSFVSLELKYKYDMNPICVTWSPLLKTEIGKLNLQNFINSGFSHVMGSPDPIATSKLTKLAFQEVGDPFQPFIYGQSNFPLHIAKCYDVKLVMYGENGEVEYGGDMKNAYIPTRTVKDYSKHYFSNIPPNKWLDYDLSQNDINPFLGPNDKYIESSKIEMHFYGYYKFWDPQENFYYAKKNCNFSVNLDRTEGTYQKYGSLDDKIDGFHHYLSFIKFGIERATSDTAHEIRDDKITREEGVALVEKFDGEFPKKYFKTFLDFCEINEDTFEEIIDSWRSEHIWKKENKKWKLRKPIWEDK